MVAFDEHNEEGEEGEDEIIVVEGVLSTSLLSRRELRQKTQVFSQYELRKACGQDGLVGLVERVRCHCVMAQRQTPSLTAKGTLRFSYLLEHCCQQTFHFVYYTSSFSPFEVQFPKVHRSLDCLISCMPHTTTFHSSRIATWELTLRMWLLWLSLFVCNLFTQLCLKTGIFLHLLATSIMPYRHETQSLSSILDTFHRLPLKC